MGAPNVGKSSLVQLLSSGLPEVQNYPFTTRSIKMGHFYVDGRRHQVRMGGWVMGRAGSPGGGGLAGFGGWQHQACTFGAELVAGSALKRGQDCAEASVLC